MKRLCIFITILFTSFMSVSQLSAQISWTKIHQFNAARVLDLVQAATDSNIFYANVADAGIWKSMDAGITWTSTGKINSSCSNHGLTVSPFNENCVIFASTPGSGAESGVFICTDGGGTWANIENQFGIDFPLTVEFSPSDSMVVYAAGDSSIYRSGDGGFTWTLQNSSNPLPESINDLKVDINNPNRLIIGTRDQIVISTDAGASWQTAGFDHATTFACNELDLVNSSLIVGASWQGLLISNDGGNNWQGIAVPVRDISYPGYSYVTVNRRNLNNILLSSYHHGIIVTIDGGNSWIDYSTGLPSYFGTFTIKSVSSSHSKIIVSGYDCGLYVAEPGIDWTRLDADLQAGGGNTWVHPLRPDTLYQPIGALGIFRSTDAGANWDRINNQIDDYSVAGWNLAFHPTNPDTIFFTTTRGVFRTYDAGNNWEYCSNGIPDSTAFWSIVIDEVNPNCVYIHHSSRGSIYRTMNGGDSWQDVSNGFAERALAMACDPFIAGHVIASCRFGRVFESFDYGDNWIEIINYDPDLYYVFGDIAFDPFNPGIIYGVIGAGHPLYDGIWKSTDNGQNWTKWDLNYPPYVTYDLNISSVVPSRLYAVLDHAGLYVSNDYGQTWNEENTGIQNLDSYMITTIPDNGDERLYFCTNTGVYTALIHASDISDKQFEPPFKFELKQNYPNPFNPITTFVFSLPKAELVTLKIYNLLGQAVLTLVSEQLNIGIHSYTWDASNFSSGVYYYKIKSGNFTKTKKLLLIK